MKVNGLAYVNLDPDNGGIILNISEGGLCFQSTAPVQSIETIRFWFSYRSQRIDADVGQAWKAGAQTKSVSRFIEARSELAWIDDTQKRGGLRFTNLPAEAREQIWDWMRQPTLVNVNEKFVPSFPPSRKSTFLSVKRSDTNASRGVSPRSNILFRSIQSGGLWTGFSGGLLAGVLVSALVVAVFFLLSHSRELGDSLIQLGERLGGRSWSKPITSGQQASSQEPHSTPQGPQPVSPESKTVSTESQKVAPVPIQAARPERLLSIATPTAAKAHGVQFEAAGPATPSLSAPSIKAPGTPAASSTAGRPSVPEFVTAPASEPSASALRTTAPEMDLAKRPSVHIEPSKVEGIEMRSERYLEVGKFKEKLLADNTTGQLSQLGFSATVIERSRLWGKSYQALVGPYGSDREAEAAHKDLVRLGFTPRSYERGKRDFSLPPALKVGGTHLPVGLCVISWESYTPNAIVKFESDRGMNVTVEGKWVKQDVRYTTNAVVYVKNKDGSHTLVEIRLSGMGRALVFGRASY
jgi:hypothetical protein